MAAYNIGVWRSQYQGTVTGGGVSVTRHLDRNPTRSEAHHDSHLPSILAAAIAAYIFLHGEYS